MTVFVRRNKKYGWWQYDIRGEHPDGTVYRERKKSALTTETATRQWAIRREGEIIAEGPKHARRQTPVLNDYWEDFERIHFENGPRGPLKPSQRRNITSDWTVHIQPALGKLRLAQITKKEIAEFTAALQAPNDEEKKRSLKTINNVLTTLNTMLNKAEQWDIAKDLPRAKLFRLDQTARLFWDFGPYAQLLKAAEEIGPRQLAVIKLGARAGLRAGEILGLRPGDIDKGNNRLHVQRSVWGDKIGLPKNGKARWQPVPPDLIKALDRVKVVGKDRFFLRDDGTPASIETLRSWVYTAEKKAGLHNETSKGQIHRLRHTYASHLVMRGITLAVVQQLMDHSSIQTTMRYAHLAPREIDRAVAVLAETDLAAA